MNTHTFPYPKFKKSHLNDFRDNFLLWLLDILIFYPFLWVRFRYPKRAFMGTFSYVCMGTFTYVTFVFSASGIHVQQGLVLALQKPPLASIVARYPPKHISIYHLGTLRLGV